MSDIFDYIDWRGDLSFTADAFNCVDGLIYSSFSYICPDELLKIMSYQAKAWRIYMHIQRHYP